MSVFYPSTILAQFDTNIALVTNESPDAGFHVSGYRFTLDKEPDSAMDGTYYLDVQQVDPHARFWGTGENISEAIIVIRTAYYRGGGDSNEGDRQSVMRNAADDSQRVADVIENPANYNSSVTGVREIRYQGSRRAADLPRAEIWESRFWVQWRSDLATLPVISEEESESGGAGVISVANLTELAAYDATDLDDFQRVWVETLRDEWYLDASSTATVTTGLIVAATPAGRWFRCVIPDILFQTQTEWWYDASGGTLEGDGLAEDTAINSIAKLARRIGDNGGITSDVTLFTALNLSASEQALLDALAADSFAGRQWRTVSGQMPFTPKLWFSAQNIDGTNNSSLTDGALISTWTNLGSLASGNATAAGSARPAFALVAESGNLRNKSAVRYTTGAQSMPTGNVTAFVQPTWMLCIFKVNAAGTRVPIDGNDGSHRNALIDSSGSPVLYAGSSSGGIPGLPAMAKSDYHAIVCVFSSDRSTAQLDGVECTTAVDSGTQVLDGIDLGGLTNSPSNSIADGDLVEAIVMDGIGTSPATMNDWIEYHYGVFPQ